MTTDGLIVSVTATRHGMTQPQRDRAARLFHEHPVKVLHHGDCVGGDATCHRLARQVGGIWIVIHPPDDPTFRAFLDGDEIRPELPYKDRDWIIAEEGRVLWAFPRQNRLTRPLRRGGTWLTWKYAGKLHRPRLIVWPDGTVHEGDL